MATLREVQKRMTHERLLDSGLAVLERKGYPATTIDDIATAAGTTRTTFSTCTSPPRRSWSASC